MASQILMPHKRDAPDPLGNIVKALQIAGQIYGFTDAKKAAKALEDQRLLENSQKEQQLFDAKEQQGLENRQKEFQTRADLRKSALIPPAPRVLKEYIRDLPGQRDKQDVLIQEKSSIYDEDPGKFEIDKEFLKQKAEAEAGGLAGEIKKIQAATALATLNEKKDAAIKRGLSPIKEFEKTDAYVGTPQEEQKLRTAQSDVKKLNIALNTIKEKVRGASKLDLANPLSDVRKSLASDLTDLQLLYKGPSFVELGVLTGPDLKLLEQIVESPGSISNLISGKPGVISRYDQLQNRVNEGFKSKAEALGLRQIEQSTTLGNKIPTKEYQGHVYEMRGDKWVQVK